MKRKLILVSFIFYVAALHSQMGIGSSAQPVTPESQLVTAAGNGDLNTVKILINQGVSVNSYARHNITPLWNAAKYGQIEVIRYLLSQGADVNLRTNFGKSQKPEDGSSALFAAIRMGTYIKDKSTVNSAREATIKMLLNAGAHLFVKEYNVITPLGAAAGVNSIPLVMLLMRRGLRIQDAPDAIETAVNLGLVDMVKFLKDRGANLNIMVDSYIPKKGKNGVIEYARMTVSLKESVNNMIKEKEDLHRSYEERIKEYEKIKQLLEDYRK